MRTTFGSVISGMALVAVLASQGAAQTLPTGEASPRDFRDGAVDSGAETGDPGGHGPDVGHLPGSSRRVRLVGRSDVDRGGPGRVADVTAYGNYAYLSVRDPEGCADAGMAVMDISDPTNPVQVGMIEATRGSFPGEGAQVVDLDLPNFDGQVLVFNNETCGNRGNGGVTLWDVTNPRAPQLLTAHAGDPVEEGSTEYHTIHSAFAWQAGNRAFVVLVDNEETADVDILEITDPRNPVFVGEFDLNRLGVLQTPPPLGAESFLHDVVVKQIRGRWTMLLSYWDGGWVQLNVNDPANPIYLADSDFPTVDPLTGMVPPEGNAHQAEYTPENRYIIGTSEDFGPYRIRGRTDDGTEFDAAQGSDTPPIDPDHSVSGQTVFVGRACPGDPAVPPAPTDDSIAVVERGVCLFTEKLEAVEAAGGYVAAIIMNREGADACTGFFVPGVEADIPVVLVGRDVGYSFFDLPFDEEECLAGDGSETAPIEIGTRGDSVKLIAVFDGWGYVHLLDRRTMQEVDAYAIDEALDPRYAEGFGALSVHEVAVDPFVPGTAYLSYYSGGLRVIEYTGGTIREVGHYIHEHGNNFWGVEVHRLPGSQATLILASDIDSGLWIFRYEPNP